MEKLYNDLRIGHENASLKRRASEQDDEKSIDEKMSKQERSNESLSNTSDIMVSNICVVLKLHFQ